MATHRVVQRDGGFVVRRPEIPGNRQHDGPEVVSRPLHYFDAVTLARAEQALDDIHGAGWPGAKHVGRLLKSMAFNAAARRTPGLSHATIATKALNAATKKGSVHEEDRVAAKAAKLAYAGAAERAALPGYVYMPDLSSPETAVWTSADGGHSMIAFRGTRPDGTTDDLETDARLAVGAFHTSNRWKRTKKELAAANRRFGFSKGRPVILTGHSLGGRIAAQAATMYPNSQLVAFNPGVGVGDGIPKAHNRGRVYSARTDLVSALAPLSAKHHDVVLVEGRQDFSDPLEAHSYLGVEPEQTGGGLPPVEPAMTVYWGLSNDDEAVNNALPRLDPVPRTPAAWERVRPLLLGDEAMALPSAAFVVKFGPHAGRYSVVTKHTADRMMRQGALRRVAHVYWPRGAR